MITCPKCGHENKDTTLICANCLAYLHLAVEAELEATSPAKKGESQPRQPLWAFCVFGLTMVCVLVLLVSGNLFPLSTADKYDYYFLFFPLGAIGMLVGGIILSFGVLRGRWSGSKLSLFLAGILVACIPVWLITGVPEFSTQVRIQYSLGRRDFRHSRLRGENLRGTDLSWAGLRDADLAHADLSYADLRGADLRSAHLGYADLEGANLSGANLHEADLWGANLEETNLKGAEVTHEHFAAKSLKGAIMPDGTVHE